MNLKWYRIIFIAVVLFVMGAVFGDTLHAQQSQTPMQPFPVNISVTAGDENGSMPLTTTLKIVLLITILSLAPTILTMVTSFTRIVIILSFMKRAIGTGSQPSAQIMVGMALFLTMYVMTPVWNEINNDALQPLFNKEITEMEAFERGIKPIRTFMFKYTRTKDLGLFIHLSKSPRPKNMDDVPTTTLIPAFIISELKTAFQMGFVLFIPFLIIDMVTASVLLAMGMIVLPPMTISMPFKILMFVMVDGWYLVIRSITMGFQ
ncbi:MAG: flagellar type III secretion system pore protein FliP [Candidatus Auribacterota bacterium]|jgi:flagellar biosynthetic protein FliP|nr:flagellar type III secretion system pore protein FliP [Candidatus Auribacterota bacterium]